MDRTLVSANTIIDLEEDSLHAHPFMKKSDIPAASAIFHRGVSREELPDEPSVPSLPESRKGDANALTPPVRSLHPSAPTTVDTSAKNNHPNRQRIDHRVDLMQGLEPQKLMVESMTTRPPKLTIFPNSAKIIIRRIR